MEPIHINLVLSKLTLRPEMCEKCSRSSKVLLSVFSDPSKKRVVSSANWDIMYS